MTLSSSTYTCIWLRYVGEYPPPRFKATRTLTYFSFACRELHYTCLLNWYRKSLMITIQTSGWYFKFNSDANSHNYVDFLKCTCELLYLGCESRSCGLKTSISCSWIMPVSQFLMENMKLWKIWLSFSSHNVQTSGKLMLITLAIVLFVHK